ncbi:ORF129 [Helicoverpa zea single nucleopolyhedrovirus]|uniref:ORF129 n=1 Tax=Helicoverpa zea single nucleopolyhedrovirus TaxID=10468 RepID=X2FQL0_9ABAC|nr:ORF129 [Helicoverpa zea single nucleopolyhedrovirus]
MFTLMCVLQISIVTMTTSARDNLNEDNYFMSIFSNDSTNTYDVIRNNSNTLINNITLSNHDGINSVIDALFDELDNIKDTKNNDRILLKSVLIIILLLCVMLFKTSACKTLIRNRRIANDAPTTTTAAAADNTITIHEFNYTNV